MRVLVAAAAAIALAGPALSEADDDTLVVEGVTYVSKAPAPAHLEGVMDEVISGWHFREDETQALQLDDFENPGMFAVEAGQSMWTQVMGSEGKSCASCHESPEDLAGVRAVYPKWDEAKGEVQTLEMQVNECVTERMGAEPLDYAGGSMIDMVTLLAFVSRGTPVDVATDGPAQSTWEKGREIYYTRYGQLELACANCHEDNWGNMIRADHLSQGQINGFPVYRLKQGRVFTPHQRFRGCVRDTRAQTFAVGSPEFVALELYVASRGNGLSVEGPSVRN